MRLQLSEGKADVIVHNFVKSMIKESRIVENVLLRFDMNCLDSYNHVKYKII